MSLAPARVIATVSFVLLVACPMGGGGLLPSPDDCATPTAGAVVDTLEVSVGEGAGFTPVADDSIVSLVRGGQGGLMLPVRLRVSGAGAPACMEQSTAVRVGANRAGFVDVPLATYADGAARTTKVLYVILYAPIAAGQAFTLEVGAGGKTVTRTLWYATRGAASDGGIDGGSDGGSDNGADGGSDGGSAP